MISSSGIAVDVENYNDIDAFEMSLEALPPKGAKFEINGALWVVVDIVWLRFKERSFHWRPCLKFEKIRDLEDAEKDNDSE